MKARWARAPGKLMLSGEYAVLEGARALVMAVDRCVTARFADEGETAGEMREATAALEAAVRRGELTNMPAPMVFDTRALAGADGQKLGLGSSAAGCVAALALGLAGEGRAMSREALGRTARRGHRAAQGGGSGADVMASALGAVVAFELTDGPDGEPTVSTRGWNPAIPWGVLWTGQSVRTSEMLQRVAALRLRGWDFAAFVAGIDACTRALERAIESGDGPTVVEAVREHHGRMQGLGEAAGAAIVTEPMARFAAAIEPFGAAVKPSGAGGGDVVLVVAENQDAFAAAMREGASLGFAAVSLAIDAQGVRVGGEDGEMTDGA